MVTCFPGSVGSSTLPGCRLPRPPTAHHRSRARLQERERGGTGRRARFRSWCPQGRGSSSLPARTEKVQVSCAIGPEFRDRWSPIGHGGQTVTVGERKEWRTRFLITLYEVTDGNHLEHLH